MRQYRSKGASALAALASLALLSGCSSNKEETNNSSPNPPPAHKSAPAGSLLGAGATFPQPIYAKWFADYSKAHPEVSVNYQAIGSGGGISQYQAGLVDFGATDAPVPDADMGKMPPTLHIPTVGGAVVMAYNLPMVKGALKLSGDVVADIYLGKLKMWNDPRIMAQNPGVALPAQSILVAHRSDGSGTTYIFTNYLSIMSPEWKTKVGAAKSVQWPTGLAGNANAGVAGIILHDAGAIGYLELAYAVKSKLAYAEIKNKSGNYVEATSASTTAAIEGAMDALKKDVRAPILDSAGPKAYPIAALTYLLVPKKAKDAMKGKQMTELLTWAMGPGQNEAASLMYAPLPKSIADANVKLIAQINK